MHISETEWIVMHLLWESPGLEAAEVIERLAVTNGWSPATVKTMLHRLTRKGALSTELHGKKYFYRAAVRRHDCLRRASRSFVERICGGDAVPALIHLVRAANLTPGQVAEIRALLDEQVTQSDGAEE